MTKYYKTYKGSEHQRQAKDKFDNDKQLSLNFKCKHKYIEEEEVQRADMEDEPTYPQIIKRCKICKKEL